MASFSLWRIAAETREYKADDLSGGGAAKYPGRWNAAGEYVVYAADSISLAVLETAAYIDSGGLPLNRFVIEISVPSRLWDVRQEIDVTEIDAAWSAVPAGKTSVDIGSNWYRSAKTTLLVVPSAIVPEARVVLINARHPSAKSITARAIRPFDYNRLFRGG